LSPVNPEAPVPTRNVMIPLTATILSRLIPYSDMNTLPLRSPNTPAQLFSAVDVATLVLTIGVVRPLPAKAVIIPVDSWMRRTTFATESAKYILPALSRYN